MRNPTIVLEIKRSSLVKHLAIAFGNSSPPKNPKKLIIVA